MSKSKSITAKKQRTKKSSEAPRSVSLLPSSNIPFNRLRLSNDNVRRVKNGLSIDDLAESIARRSLLQSLSVRPVFDAEGNETGDYEVQAGGRRYRALQRLVKARRLTEDAPVPCIVKTAGVLEDDSLAENTERQDLHPIDQYRAFAAMKAKGVPNADIAAAHNVSERTVEQRLRLAAAAPELVDAYIADVLTLEDLMAFCIVTDQARQRQVFEAFRKGHVQRWNIRDQLTEDTIAADDPRALYIGRAAYEKAGGTILRDLFSEEDEGYFANTALLTDLVAKKLEDARQEELRRGWAWVEAAVDIRYELRADTKRLKPLDVPLSKVAQKRLDALTREYDALAELPELSKVQEKRYNELASAIDALANPRPEYGPDDMARAGVFIDIDSDGQLAYSYGHLRESADAACDADDGYDHDESAPDAADASDDLGTELPERLIVHLTTHRTLALRNALTQHPDVAFVAVLHALASDIFYPCGHRSALQISAKTHGPASTPGLEAMPYTRAMEARSDAWRSRLPEEAHDLWPWLNALSPNDQRELFAYCAAATINAVRDSRFGDLRRFRNVDELAEALELDMTRAGFVANADTYFSAVTKGKIIADVTEALGSAKAQLIVHLKKADMAKEAARLLAGTGWLPEPLRAPSLAVAPAHDSAASELPAFLAKELPVAAE